MDYRATASTINAPECEPPQETMNDKINRTMATLKDLIIAMDDTGIALFNAPVSAPEERQKDPDCMDHALDVIDWQARTAMEKFLGLRKRKL